MTVIHIPDWKDAVTFTPNGLKINLLTDSAKAKFLIAGLEAGQKIPTHPASLGMYHFLEGNGWMIIEGERYPVQAGTTIIAPDGASRGMEAITRLAFLAVRTPGTEGQ